MVNVAWAVVQGALWVTGGWAWIEHILGIL